MRKIIAIIACVTLLAMSSVAFASEATDNRIEKLGRGAANIFTSPYEIIYRINESNDKDGVGAAFTWGILYGVVRMGVRAVVGVYEMATFPVPLPSDYKPIITDPEYFFFE